MEYNYSKMESPVGRLHLLSDGTKLVGLIFDSNWKDFSLNYNGRIGRESDELIRATEKELTEYFAGIRTTFDVDVGYAGTAFQQRAWESLRKIPFGKTICYSEQATEMKNPKAVRAVGRANGQNRIAIIIPCHRVVGKNGSLTGFSGGIKIKEHLLKLESRRP